MSLKPDLKKNIADVLQKNGMPPIIDKTFNSIWETFAKTQPSKLNTTRERSDVVAIGAQHLVSGDSKVTGDTDVWGNLQRTMEKFSVDPKYAKQVVTRLQKKYGEKPDNSAIKGFMS